MSITKEKQDVLHQVFSGVQNVYDWKAPIDAIIDPSEKEIVTEAIIYFTATEPKFEQFSTDMLRVTADGYRRGPAGDH